MLDLVERPRCGATKRGFQKLVRLFDPHYGKRLVLIAQVQL